MPLIWAFFYVRRWYTHDMTDIYDQDQGKKEEDKKKLFSLIFHYNSGISFNINYV